jgi:glutamate decarboxylase
MPDDATDVAVLRVVVREGFSRDMARVLHQHLVEVMNGLRKLQAGGHMESQHFAH